LIARRGSAIVREHSTPFFTQNSVARCALAALVLLLAAAGCAGRSPRMNYAFGEARDYRLSPKLAAVSGEMIERGESRPILDAVGWVLGIPNKIVLWDSRIDNHDISFATELAVQEYLVANELSGVKVRLNQYAPLDEWKRLVANDAVGAGWRYTFGTVYWLGDAIFPGRVWGGDRYNPYTNTIQIYSDVPAVAWHEAGHAKDFARRKYKGTYAALYVLPVFPLWHERNATHDALDYVVATQPPDEQEEAYRLLYPAYGTYVGNALGGFVPGPPAIPFVGSVLVGHVAGRIEGQRVANRSRREESEGQPRLERLPDLNTQ
jgi:hypothetical protein